ncbi:unnamed protein product [Dracunculus medinensis]|uniref:Nucleoside-diphosphate kinase n=1 Tax=Dracunculus medinensis TaxID=318479 RepID=A0A0N4US66_DRAME|nr:unnamed protein product [Dracunculus medinensis]
MKLFPAKTSANNSKGKNGNCLASRKSSSDLKTLVPSADASAISPDEIVSADVSSIITVEGGKVDTDHSTIAETQNSTTSEVSPKELLKNSLIILIIGPPGACKNEIAQLVAVKYGFFYISMGESLRQKVSKNQDDELWKKIGEKMNIGDPIPMKICRNVLYNEMLENGSQNSGFIIVGYPRTQQQAKDFLAQV